MASVTANGIQVEYESFGDSSSPALLLIIGLGGQLIYWQEAFCQQIADNGYYVIRYDNRDVGLSTKIEGLSTGEIMEKIGALFMAQKVRTDDIKKLKVPSLIVHGDADPLVPIAGGKATADAIPGAEFMVVEGMGHVVPNLNAYWDDIKDAIIAHMGKAI